jgi:hypothetical protein
MIKNRIEKLERERPQVAPQPNYTLIRELTAEEFEALYAEGLAAEEKRRQESRSQSSK